MRAVVVLINGNRGNFRTKPTVHTLCSQIRIEIAGQPQFEVAVDATEARAAFAELSQADRDVPIYAANLRGTSCLAEFDATVDSLRFQRPVNITGSDAAVNALKRQRDLTRRFDRDLFLWVTAKQVLPKPQMVLLTAHQQAVTRLLDNQFPATERAGAVRRAFYENLGCLCVRGLNVYRTIDALDSHPIAGFKLEGLSRLVARHAFRIVGRNPNSSAQALADATVRAPQPQASRCHDQDNHNQY